MLSCSPLVCITHPSLAGQNLTFSWEMVFFFCYLFFYLPPNYFILTKQISTFLNTNKITANKIKKLVKQSCIGCICWAI